MNKIFINYFDPANIILDNKDKKIRGDLIDISAKNEAMVVSILLGGRSFVIAGEPATNACTDVSR